jgi:hypothetical protein
MPWLIRDSYEERHGGVRQPMRWREAARSYELKTSKVRSVVFEMRSRFGEVIPKGFFSPRCSYSLWFYSRSS